MHHKVPRLVLAVALAVLALTATPALAVKGAAITIKALNAQRKQNGIPAGITQNDTWSKDCLKHDKWMGRNGTVSHYEDPGSPGYTKGGAWAAANSVLAAGVYPFDKPEDDPYLDAPYHLEQILHPRLDEMGAAWIGYFDCETTFPGYKRHHPRKDKTWSYPGRRGSISWFENAQEVGGVPGDSVGLPQGTYTGPNLIVYWDGPQKPAPLDHVEKASLTGPGGAKVATRVVDDRNGTALPGTGFVIPVHPLEPSTTYRARVKFAGRGAGRTVKRSWTFTTEPLRTGSDAVSFHIERGDSQITVSLYAHDKAYLGRHATLRISSSDYSYPPSDMRIGSRTTGTQAETFGTQHGETFHLTADVKPFTIGSTHVKGFEIKRDVSAP